MDSRSVSAWMGLGFELVCLAHHRQIKAALGIAGVGTAISSWRSKADSDKNMPGFQIDMIIERADRIIHLCEMKFSTGIVPYGDKNQKDIGNHICHYIRRGGRKT